MLSNDMERYIELNRAAGFKYIEIEQILKRFVTFAMASGDELVRIDRVLDWVTRTSSSQQQRRLLQFVRRFALFLQAEDSRHEVPAIDAAGRARAVRPLPYIYETDEIDRLLLAARQLDPQDSIRPLTYMTLFGLLASTGLRISEAIALKYQDFTEDGLIIKETKFKKSRLVPVHSTTQMALEHYLSVRMKLACVDSNLFVSTKGVALRSGYVQILFRQLTQSIGLTGKPGQRLPRIHDLRHTFAVRSLEQCGHDRDSVARHAVALSTYLGHTRVTDTYWYLEATPLLLSLIAEAGETLHQRGNP